MSGHCPRGASQNGSKSYFIYGGSFDHQTVNDRKGTESDCIMTVYNDRKPVILSEESSEESFNFRVIYARQDQRSLKAPKVYFSLIYTFQELAY